MKTHVISTRISDEVYDWLYVVSSKRNIAISTLIFEILKESKGLKKVNK